jgi:Kef-type K+ transport system membrane component KefB
MELFLELALAMAVLILVAKLGGYISLKLGQPSVLGELLVGVIFGPSLVNFLHLSFFTEQDLEKVIGLLAEMGVMMLMFIAGLELHLTDLLKSGKAAILVGSLGVLFPLLISIGFGLLSDMDLNSSIFLGLILAATSVSISVQTLMELKVIRSEVGITLLGAAVFDDILVILGLSIFTAVSSSDGGSKLSQVAIILGEMIVFLIIAIGVGWFLFPKLSRRVNNLPVSQGLISFVVVVLLLFGWLSEKLGHMAPITGAFIAGIFFARSSFREKIYSGISVLAYSIFVPIFFISVGLSANIRLLVGEAFWLFLLLVIIAIVGKVLGAGIGALIGKMKSIDALRIGVGMVSRGEVGLIVAAYGLSAKLITEQTFSAVVGVVLVTTLITPFALKALYRTKIESSDEQKEAE